MERLFCQSCWVVGRCNRQGELHVNSAREAVFLVKHLPIGVVDLAIPASREDVHRLSRCRGEDHEAHGVRERITIFGKRSVLSRSAQSNPARGDKPCRAVRLPYPAGPWTTAPGRCRGRCFAPSPVRPHGVAGIVRRPDKQALFDQRRRPLGHMAGSLGRRHIGLARRQAGGNGGACDGDQDSRGDRGHSHIPLPGETKVHFSIPRPNGAEGCAALARPRDRA